MSSSSRTSSTVNFHPDALGEGLAASIVWRLIHYGLCENPNQLSVGPLLGKSFSMLNSVCVCVQDKTIHSQFALNSDPLGAQVGAMCCNPLPSIGSLHTPELHLEVSCNGFYLFA